MVMCLESAEGEAQEAPLKERCGLITAQTTKGLIRFSCRQPTILDEIFGSIVLAWSGMVNLSDQGSGECRVQNNLTWSDVFNVSSNWSG